MSFVRVPPDSTGKKVYTKESTVGSDVVQTQIVHLADSDFPENLLSVDARGSASVRFAEGQPNLSGFGNLKISQQRALGVYESSQASYDDLFTITTANGGSSDYEPTASSHILRTTGIDGSRVVRTTNRYHYYLPGTSNFINMTIACGDTGKPNNIRRWGAFDDNDGMFFELNGNTLNVVLRSSISGEVVDNRVAQSEWNSDRADGTGVSKHVFNVTNINVYWMDYQWLGAGRVRFGIFEPNGARLVLHEFQNAGLNTLPYMRSGTLPLRTENINVGTVGSTSELRECCMAVYAEGNINDYTYWRFSDMEAEGVSVTTNTHLFSVRSKPTLESKHNSVNTLPETLNVYCSSPVAISIYEDTLVTGGSWSIASRSSLEGTTDGTLDISAAHRMKTFYFETGAHSIDLSKYFEPNDEGIITNVDGTAKNWSLVATRLTTNTTVVTCNMGYRELW